MVDTLGASNPTIHMAQTNTSRSGLVGSLNSSSRASAFIRARWGLMSRPLSARVLISFWPWLTTTAMSVVSISSMRLASQGRSSSGRLSCKVRSSVEVLCPFLLHQVVHADGGRLVDADVHGLAGEPSADEVPDKVLGHGAQPLGSGDQRILPTEPTHQTPFGVLVEFGLLQQLGQFVGEVLVDELKLGDAVLVVERDGGTVLDGVSEVVDADVVTELPLGQLLSGSGVGCR